jgi:hypothetical protein
MRKETDEGNLNCKMNDVVLNQMDAKLDDARQ